MRAPEPAFENLARESTLLGRETRLSLIAAALTGVMELAESLGEEELRRALFRGTLRALELREETRRELRELRERAPLA